MPSILATAALAALSGGRKLDGSGITACSHDICGRKLLTRASDHGTPTFIETPADGNSAAFQYTAGGALGANGVFTGYGSTVVNIIGSGADEGKIRVLATMGDDYQHTARACVLKVTPTILEGAGVSSDVTSATFNPAVDPADANNKYAEVQTERQGQYDSASKTLEVILDHPQVDGISLGYLGVELDLKLDCKNDAFTQQDFNLYVAENGAGGQYYTNQNKVQVRHKFQESSGSGNTLEFYGGVGGITLASTYSPETGADLAVQATATAELKTSAGLRFPAGQWDDGTHDFGSADAANTIDCSVVQTVKTAFSDLDGWYNSESADPETGITYEAGEDDDCNQANTICTSRKHTKSIVYDTTLGFQIPLSTYYDAQPKIQCVDAAASSTKEASVNLDLHATGCGGLQCKLGDIARKLAFPSVGSAQTSSFGDDLYADDATLGVKDLFTIQKATATAWYDLADFYDYTFNVKSTASQCSTIECTGAGVSTSSKAEVSGGTTLQIAAQIAIAHFRDISALQAALTAKITAIAGTITRPITYGETRSAYTIANPTDDTDNTLSNGIEIRRDSSNIRVDLTPVPDAGSVEYVQDSKDTTIGFDGPELAWRDDLGDATLNVAGTSIATSAEVRVADVAATDLVFFKDQGEGQGQVSDTDLFDQTVDSTADTCDKDYCQSPQGGNKWLCSAQSATFSLEVGKESLDSREADKKVLTKLYSVPADVSSRAEGGNIPINPSVDPSITVKYRIAGTSPDAEYKSVAVSADTGTTDELTFGVISGGARVFDCSTQASQTVSYKAGYRQPCDKVLKQLPYSEPYAMVYSADQVAPSAATRTTEKFSEYILQRDGQDIVFTISPSAVQTYGLPFSSNLDVKVVYKGATLTNEVTCVVDGASGVATCTLKDFQDADYDDGHKLGDNDNCGDRDASGSIEGSELACPQLSLKIYESFAIPEITAEAARPKEGNTDGGKMFYPDTVGSAATCGAASVAKHLISDGALTIDVLVDGSELTHKSKVEFFNNGAASPFATAAAQGADDTAASGATSEYKTTIPFEDDVDEYPVEHLEADLSDLKLKLKLDGEGGPRPVQIKNLGADYQVFLCNNPSSFAGCINAGEDNLLDTAIKVPSAASPSTFTIIVRKLGGGDPCQDKILGAEAYDGGFKFQITQAATGFTLGQPNTYDFSVHQAHEYTLPIRCHEERDVKVLNQVPSDSTDAWNDKFLDVTLTGSAIDYRKQVSISPTGLEGALRLGDGQSDLSALIARQVAGSDGALTARLTLDYDDTGGCVAENLDAALLWGGAALKTVAGDDAEHTLQCPSNELGIEIGGVSIANGALLSALSVGDDNFKNFGDVFMIKMAMTGRDSELHDEVEVSISADDGSDESVQFLDGSISENIKDKGKGVSDVFFRMVGRQDGTDGNGDPLYRIQCSTLTVVLTSKTTQNGQDLEFKFKIKCPRQNSASDASDAVNLEYGVETLHFGHTESTIKIKADPEDAPSASVIHLGSCVGDVATPGDDDGTCALTTGLQTFGGASPLSATGVLNLFAKCGGSTMWNDLPEETGTSITSTAYVARSYQHAKTHFATAKFCSTTALHITVDKSATKEITIAVAADRDMDFVVHVSQAEWDSTGCPADQYRLVTKVDMERKLQSVDSEFSSTGIENYERSSTGGLFSLFYKSDGTSQLTDAYEAGDSTLIAETVCKPATDATHSLSFDMRVALNGVNYYSSASVQMSVSPPDSIEDDEATYDGQLASFADSLSIVSLCDITGNALLTACPKELDGVTLSDIPTNENIQLTLVIGSEELAAFAHQISEPRISFDGKRSDETTLCDLYTSCQEIKDLDDTQFQAVVASNGAKADLRSTDKRTVTLQLSSLGGQTNIVVGWTVSRIHSSSRRLRSVEHVTYNLGADGSVSKSSSFAVLPAVRDSEDASAVTTKEQITEQELDADGNAVGTATVVNRTTVQHDKSGEDHTLAVLGIVFGGLGSVAAIAVAFFVGCASRKDAQGVGSSFSTVAGGFSDRQPLFNRNRFAPSDF